MQEKKRQILIAKANGLMVKQIADKFSLHRRTVEWNLKSACMELKALNSIHAVAIAMRDGIIFSGEIGCILILCWSGLFGEEDVRRCPRPAQFRSARREIIV